MFDLDLIEAEWQENSFKLSEEEIIEIYRSEGVTKKKYKEEVAEYFKKRGGSSTAEERLLKSIFGECEEEEEKEEIKFPERKRLSLEKQKIVIEGSMDIVFEETRYWYKLFNEQIKEEDLYYVCLEALINSVKYIIHCEKKVFKMYVLKSIENNIIVHIAKWEHLPIKRTSRYYLTDVRFFFMENDLSMLKYDYEKDTPEKPSRIYHRLRNESYDIDYIKDTSSEEFTKVYKEALEDLGDLEREVMKLVFDANGNRVLTYSEISDYLGIEKNKIVNAKRRAIRKLKKDERILMYKQK